MFSHLIQYPRASRCVDQFIGDWFCFYLHSSIFVYSYEDAKVASLFTAMRLSRSRLIIIDAENVLKITRHAMKSWWQLSHHLISPLPKFKVSILPIPYPISCRIKPMIPINVPTVHIAPHSTIFWITYANNTVDFNGWFFIEQKFTISKSFSAKNVNSISTVNLQEHHTIVNEI